MGLRRVCCGCACRLPVPARHITLWAAEEANQLGLSSTPARDAPTSAAWGKIFSNKEPAGGMGEARCLTHDHPDHAGNRPGGASSSRLDVDDAGRVPPGPQRAHAGAGYHGRAVSRVFAQERADAEERRAGDGDPDESLGRSSCRNSRTRTAHPGRRDPFASARDCAPFVGYGHAPDTWSLYCKDLNVCHRRRLLLATISTKGGA